MKRPGLFFCLMVLCMSSSTLFSQQWWTHSMEFQLLDGNGETKSNAAFMYIGDMEKAVRGVVLTSMTRNEWEFNQDPDIRDMATKEGLAMIFMHGGLNFGYPAGGSMSVFNPDRGHDTALNRVLTTFARQAGKPEIAHAPWFLFGHSTSGLFARYVTWWKPLRVFGMILYKSGGYDPPAFVEHPDTATFLNIPWMSLQARYDKNEPGQGAWNITKNMMMPWRERGALMQMVVEPLNEEGHSLWRPFNGPFLAEWIRKAARYKIPEDSAAVDGPVTLKTIDPSEGVVSDSSIARIIDIEELPENLLNYQYDTDKSDWQKMFWHFDDEMAIQWVNYHHKEFDPFIPDRDSSLEGDVKFWRSEEAIPVPGNGGLYLTGREPGGEFSERLKVKAEQDGSFEMKAFGKNIQAELDLPQACLSETSEYSGLKNINGYDVFRLKQIADRSEDYKPTLPEILAADVNIDGEVNQQDYEQLVARAVFKISEFSQEWNPSSNESPAIRENPTDHLFFEKGKTRFNLLAKISRSYPEDDGRGYSATRLPYISDKVDVAYSPGNPYPIFGETRLLALQVGDVDGSAEYVNTDSTEGVKLILALYETMADNEGFNTPVYIESTAETDVFSADLRIRDENDDQLFIGVESSQSGICFGNQAGKNIYIISFLESGMDTGFPVFSVKTLLPPNSSDIISLMSFVNGKAVESEIRINPLKANEEGVSPPILLYPNPAQDVLKIRINDERYPISIKLMDISGKVIKKEGFKESKKEIIFDIRDIQSGLYFIGLDFESEAVTYSFVKK